MDYLSPENGAIMIVVFWGVLSVIALIASRKNTLKPRSVLIYGLASFASGTSLGVALTHMF